MIVTNAGRSPNPWRHVEHTGLTRGGIVSLEVRADEVEQQTDNRIALMAELVKRVVSCGVSSHLVHIEELSRAGSPQLGKLWPHHERVTGDGLQVRSTRPRVSRQACRMRLSFPAGWSDSSLHRAR